MQAKDLGTWKLVCRRSELKPEKALRFDADGRTFAIYRTLDDRYYATDGLCTHEDAHLADGWLEDNIIECPKHGGRFDVSTGRAMAAPVCINLRTYQIRIDDDAVYILLVG